MAAVKNVPTQNALQYTLDAQYNVGGTTLTLNSSVSSVIQAPGEVVVDRVDTNGNKTPTKRTYYSFTGVSGNQLTGVALADGTDQTHAVGAVVELVPTVGLFASFRNAIGAVVDLTTGNLDTTKVAPASSLPTGSVVGTTDTQTLTNKRITPRITTITSSATPTVNTDNCDCVTITALATAITSMTTNLSGTPTNFQKLIFRIKDDGTARAITWGASFEAKGVDLPTTTVISKVLTVGFIYDTVTSKWGCVASAQEA